MYDQPQPHLPTTGRFTEDRADVQDPQAPDFEEVGEQVRTAAFEHGGGDAREFDDVVRDKTVAAGNQLQGEFRLAAARIAGDKHPDPEHVHQHAV